MQIVVDIEDSVYHQIKQHGEISEFHKLIIHGIPLSKGHGRLGDLDALKKEVSSWGMNDYEPSDFTDEIDRTDTIIPADKAESER